jgi:hypothetical protein
MALTFHKYMTCSYSKRLDTAVMTMAAIVLYGISWNTGVRKSSTMRTSTDVMKPASWVLAPEQIDDLNLNLNSF